MNKIHLDRNICTHTNFFSIIAEKCWEISTVIV